MFNLRMLILAPLMLLVLLTAVPTISAQDAGGKKDFDCSKCEVSELCILSPKSAGEGFPGGGNSICVPTIDDSQFVLFLYLGSSGILSTIYTSAYGIAALWLIVGGILYMVGKVDQGKQNMMWAVLGLLMLFFSGLILSTINNFYEAGDDGSNFEFTNNIIEYIIPTTYAQGAAANIDDVVCKYIRNVEVKGVNDQYTLTCEGDNEIFNRIIETVITALLMIAGGAIVLMIVYGGSQLLLSFGSESALERGKSTILMAILGFVLVLVSQTIVSIVATAIGSGTPDAGAPGNFTHIAEDINSIFDYVIGIVSGVLTTLFIIVIIIAGFQLLFSEGKDEKFNRARTSLVWGIIGVVVVNMAQVIARVIISLQF